MASSFKGFIRRSVPGLLRSVFRALGRTDAATGPTSRRVQEQQASVSATAKRAHVRPGKVAGGTGVGEGLSVPYPGDFTGTASTRYAPKPDGRPDPGEIVWTWVPYEEDYSRGKDRPVLLVGSTGSRLLALMLTSKDHVDDQRSRGDYLDLGTGPWDRQGRPSEVKVDRVLQIDPRDIRREGAVLDARRFAQVAAALRSRHGWR